MPAKKSARQRLTRAERTAAITCKAPREVMTEQAVSATRRPYTAPPQAERCTANVILRDGSGAQCMHRATKDGRCWQHQPDSIAGQPHHAVTDAAPNQGSPRSRGRRAPLRGISIRDKEHRNG
jgi:hypothetical protein